MDRTGYRHHLDIPIPQIQTANQNLHLPSQMENHQIHHPPPPPLTLPSDPPFLDLTLAPYSLLSPKPEPKLEPLDDLDELLSPIFNPHLHSNPHSTPKPEPPSSFPTSSDGSDDLPIAAAVDGDLFAYIQALHLHLRASFTHRRRSAGSADPLALAVVPSPAAGALAAASAAAWRKPQPRSSEMVRVSSSDPRDQQLLRDTLRLTRAIYESLRLILSELSSRPATSIPRRSRSDLDTAALMTRVGLWLNRDKRIIGSVPGILVGDIFFFRMELCVVGLHGQVQAGIDYVPPTRTTNHEPIATSIVVSGGYEDDEDTGNVIIYTGHGGREKNLTRQAIDQRLEGGNLALERSKHYGIEIRVIRGFKYEGSPSGRVYVYDGLYRVVDCWLDVGKSGFKVCKFKLIRIAGQDEMGSVVIRQAEDLKDRLRRNAELPAGYLSADISMGKETVPVSLYNDIDGDRYPMLFDYLSSPVYPAGMVLGRGGGDRGCLCVTNCGEDCLCAERNGGDFAYDANGILLMGKPLIYECGSGCRCPPTCRNRVTQKGVTRRLEVFRSLETGWGVRSLDLIRAGSFICEYSGIVLTRQQAEVLSMNGDSLVHPKRFPNRWYEWGDISKVLPEYPRPMFPQIPCLDFAMDVSRTRNVACYLSQSCSPNVFLQLVLFDHYDTSYPHLMIFAMENIPPLRELSIDYGVDDALAVRE